MRKLVYMTVCCGCIAIYLNAYILEWMTEYSEVFFLLSGWIISAGKARGSFWMNEWMKEKCVSRQEFLCVSVTIYVIRTRGDGRLSIEAERERGSSHKVRLTGRGLLYRSVASRSSFFHPAGDAFLLFSKGIMQFFFEREREKQVFRKGPGSFLMASIKWGTSFQKKRTWFLLLYYAPT